MSARVRVGVLVSGGGTNLQAILDAARAPDYPAEIALVFSNVAEAGGLERARRAGVPTASLSHRGWPDRASFDAAVVDLLRQHGVEWVCLAGYLRIVTPTLLGAFPWRVLNIHPALLPSFPGMHAQRQALEAGVRVTGATVHLVDAGTDTGPILAQGAVPVLPDDTEATLSARVLQVEHRLYPMVLRWAVEGRIRVEGRRAVLDLPPGERPYVLAGAGTEPLQSAT